MPKKLTAIVKPYKGKPRIMEVPAPKRRADEKGAFGEVLRVARLQGHGNQSTPGQKNAEYIVGFQTTEPRRTMGLLKKL